MVKYASIGLCVIVISAAIVWATLPVSKAQRAADLIDGGMPYQDALDITGGYRVFGGFDFGDTRGITIDFPDTSRMTITLENNTPIQVRVFQSMPLWHRAWDWMKSKLGI